MKKNAKYALVLEFSNVFEVVAFESQESLDKFLDACPEAEQITRAEAKKC